MTSKKALRILDLASRSFIILPLSHRFMAAFFVPLENDTFL